VENLVIPGQSKQLDILPSRRRRGKLNQKRQGERKKKCSSRLLNPFRADESGVPEKVELHVQTPEMERIGLEV